MTNPHRRSVLATGVGALCLQGRLWGDSNVPDGMVRIPAGPFAMGWQESRHTVRLSEYFIGKYPVTNAQFRAFCDAAGGQYRPAGQGRGGGPRCYWDRPAFDWNLKANHPVLWVGYNQAIAYCKWAAAQTGWTVDLPSEAQWERAARGVTKTGAEFEYPWGNGTTATDYRDRLNFNVLCAVRNGSPKTVNGRDYPNWPFVVRERGSSAMAANFKAVAYAEPDGANPDSAGRDIDATSPEVRAVWASIMEAGGYTTPVGAYPPGPSGCCDMAGNAFEWTRDYYTISSYIGLADKTEDPCVEDETMLTAEDRRSGSDGGRGGRQGEMRGTKIIRGGSWYAHESSCRTHYRTETRAAGQAGYHSVGFRVVMKPPISK